MVLLALSNGELVITIAIAAIVVLLLGYLCVHLAKIKVEKDIDSVSIETIKMKESMEQPIAKKVDIDNIEETVINNNEENKPEIKLEKEDKKLSEIEIMLSKMQNDLESQTKKEISDFEAEQEEKSIISYKQLKAVKDTIIPYADEVEENLLHTLPTVNKILSKLEKENEKEDVVNKQDAAVSKTNKQYENNFSKSDFISPVYGKLVEKKLDYPTIPNFKNDIDEKNIEIENNEYEPFMVDYSDELKEETIEPFMVDYVDAKEENSFTHGVDYDKKSNSLINNIAVEEEKNLEFLNNLKSFRDNLK